MVESYKKGFEKYSGVKRKKLSTMDFMGVDPQIRSVVIKLNENGFQTVMSCAGHTLQGYKPVVFRGSSGLHVRGYGYIVIKKNKYNRTRVFNILKQYGLNGLQQHVGSMHGHGVVVVSFNPIGHKARSDNSISWLMTD